MRRAGAIAVGLTLTFLITACTPTPAPVTPRHGDSAGRAGDAGRTDLDGPGAASRGWPDPTHEPMVLQPRLFRRPAAGLSVPARIRATDGRVHAAIAAGRGDRDNHRGAADGRAVGGSGRVGVHGHGVRPGLGDDAVRGCCGPHRRCHHRRGCGNRRRAHDHRHHACTGRQFGQRVGIRVDGCRRRPGVRHPLPGARAEGSTLTVPAGSAAQVFAVPDGGSPAAWATAVGDP